MEIVKVPTVKSIKSSFGDFAKAGLGGLGLAILAGIFGPLAFVAAPVLAGSIFKGKTGELIVGISGVLLGLTLLSGGTSSTSSDAGTM